MKSDYNIVFQPFLGNKESLMKIVVKHDGVLIHNTELGMPKFLLKSHLFRLSIHSQ